MHQECPRINNNSSVVVMTTRQKGCVVPQHRLGWGSRGGGTGTAGPAAAGPML